MRWWIMSKDAGCNSQKLVGNSNLIEAELSTFPDPKLHKDEIINASISSSYKNKQLLKTTASI